jgi:hypothetical protein
MPALLIGAGITMLLTGTTGADVAGAAASGMKKAAAKGVAAARGAASNVADAGSDAASAATDALDAAAARVKDTAVDVRDRAAERIAAARQSMEAGAQAVGDRMGSTKEQLQADLDEGREAFRERSQQTAAAADRLAARTRTRSEEMGRGIARLIDEQPILMAALGAALGAAVGAALPLTEVEKDALTDPGANALRKGRKAVATAGDVVREEVSTEIGAKAGDIADKVVHNVIKEPTGPGDAKRS